MKVFSMIMAFMMFAIFLMTLYIGLTTHNEESAIVCMVSGVLFFISFRVNIRENVKHEIREIRRKRDRKRYGNRDFTQEDELIYKALKHKT